MLDMKALHMMTILCTSILLIENLSVPVLFDIVHESIS